MRRFRFFFAVAVVAIVAVSCEREIIPDKIWDKPSCEFLQESMTVAAEGGEMVIPVESTGVDNVYISYKYGDMWDVNTDNGDLTPKDGWIELVKVITDYDESTRALPIYHSGISIKVEPNTTGYERVAKITVQSFTKSDSIEIIQSAE